MNRPKVDILIATQQKKKSTIYAIKSALNQTLIDIRVNVILDEKDNPSEELRQLEKEDKRLRIVFCPWKGKEGPGMAYRWALENLDIADWFTLFGDDDLWPYWAIEELYKNSKKELGMIIGKCYAFENKNHKHLTIYGKIIKKAFITGACCLYNMRLLETLPKPWYNTEVYESDWELIKKMKAFPYKQIDAIVHLLSMWQFDKGDKGPK